MKNCIKLASHRFLVSYIFCHSQKIYYCVIISLQFHSFQLQSKIWEDNLADTLYFAFTNIVHIFSAYPETFHDIDEQWFIVLWIGSYWKQSKHDTWTVYCNILSVITVMWNPTIVRTVPQVTFISLASNVIQHNLSCAMAKVSHWEISNRFTTSHLSTCHLCIIYCPVIIAHCSPRSII